VKLHGQDRAESFRNLKGFFRICPKARSIYRERAESGCVSLIRRELLGSSFLGRDDPLGLLFRRVHERQFVVASLIWEAWDTMVAASFSTSSARVLKTSLGPQAGAFNARRIPSMDSFFTPGQLSDDFLRSATMRSPRQVRTDYPAGSHSTGRGHVLQFARKLPYTRSWPDRRSCGEIGRAFGLFIGRARK
jgi:hypothetical protein